MDTSTETTTPASTETTTATAPETTTATESTPAVETPAPGGSPNTPPVKNLGGDEATVPVAPAYTPNFKYKARGKEMEIDPFFRSLIKDPESEDKVRQLFTKAEAIQWIQRDRDEIKNKYQDSEKKHSKLEKTLNTLSGFVQKGDMHSFFQSLQIPEEKVLQYALERVNYREMSSEQRAQVDAHHNERHRALSLEEQNREVVQNYEQAAQRARQLELEQELSRPEISDFVKNYDGRVGKAGAFFEQVVMRGQYHAAVNRVDISAADAIKEVISAFGGTTPQGAAPQAQNDTLPQAGASMAPVPQQNKPVIPNIRGNGTSPVKRFPTTMAELKAIAKQKSAGE